MKYSLAVYHQEICEWMDLCIYFHNKPAANIIAEVYGDRFEKKFCVIAAENELWPVPGLTKEVK